MCNWYHFWHAWRFISNKYTVNLELTILEKKNSEKRNWKNKCFGVQTMLNQICHLLRDDTSKNISASRINDTAESEPINETANILATCLLNDVMMPHYDVTLWHCILVTISSSTPPNLSNFQFETTNSFWKITFLVKSFDTFSDGRKWSVCDRRGRYSKYVRWICFQQRYCHSCLRPHF